MRLTALGEVVDVLSGFAFKSSEFNSEGRGLPIIRIRDVVPGQSSTFYEGEYRKDFVVQDGDLLVGMDGEFNRATWRGGVALLNQRVCKLTPDRSSVDHRYLYHVLPKALQAIEDRTPFVTVKHLSAKELKAESIPLPPLEEQKRIAAILDKADALRRLRQQAIDRLNTLSQSIFFKYFGRAGAPPVSVRKNLPVLRDGWAWVPLKDVARMTTGHTPDRKIERYWDGEIPWISLKDVRRLDGTIGQSTELRISEHGLANSSAVLLPEGTVCLSRTASIGFATIMGRDMSTSQDFVNWICGSQILSEYLLQAFIAARSELRGIATGSTHQTIYFPTAKQFKVLLPPLELQEAFTEHVKMVRRVHPNLTIAGERMETLFASLQQRAFAGEL